ncbi:MAG: sulfate reduction electron transfer complex DsrMKJOP subunit DsrJ [Acidobacteria bacterium]|nr:sulfate reduction electron transfer complex DsrMKJOP subunit DsrJ [Acidobacteriota bacterium]
MHDAGKILTGLAIFLALATLPIWLNALGRADVRPPELVIVPEGLETGGCIYDADTMRREHMQILNEWRDDVVRHGDRIFVAPDGRQFNKSLSHTCLGCHQDVENFCYKCHDYTNVTPYCWSCHVDRPGGL